LTLALVLALILIFIA